ncbi:dTDP-4-dehydrorhamnose reductase [Sandarakinorhabdus oryzae]|uniref:dTDP-4-dehydrorhamnose reductase n=1 Tax=Sandarakinorhabdus oryzae TaxID=2675220 RepID=UPI0012E0DB9C|nr:dTDP-4-dehydrorhamnose reductase [Sandarakinorhabdus oryzae]
MKVLITGGTGQLGRALIASAPAGVTIVAPPRTQLDLADPASIAAVIAAEQPSHIINCAAHVAVDRAESEPELAMRLNGTAAGEIAAAAAACGARLVQISTDFVFDGEASRPWAPDAATNPLSVYGRTKLAGEQAVRAAHPAPLVLRTAWVYGAHGNNFVRTMLRLMAERPEVRVIADQTGTPTHVTSLAAAIWQLRDASGTLHWTDAGTASWYDLAAATQAIACRLGLLDHAVPVLPIGTADYPVPARRPAYSVLDKAATWAITGPARHWLAELELCLAGMVAAR